MTRGLFEGIVAVSTIALAFAVARWLPPGDQADRGYLGLGLAFTGVVVGNWLWRRTQRGRCEAAQPPVVNPSER